ncbi:MAG TPA: hypothetical protein VLV78_00380 [Thermoanaerobaculia bacterium]|nr:hypothetical protein [Thermoanaerobaculia bacterium]
MLQESASPRAVRAGELQNVGRIGLSEPKKPDQVPTWGDDPLSAEFFAQAHFNERAASLNYPDVYALVQEANSIFAAVNAAVERDSNEVLLLPRLFVVRTRAAFLAGARLAMAGEIPEAFPVLRLAIELAWYGLHIAQDATGDRARVWLKRGDNKAATDACKNEFTIRRVRTTHESVDPQHAAQMHQLYESTIDLGAHPNQLGLFSAIGNQTVGKQTTFQVGILYPAEFPLLATLGMAMLVAFNVLRIFQLIFPERFKIMQLDSRIAQLLGSIQNVLSKRNIARPPNSA